MKVKIKVDWMGAGRTGVSLGQNIFIEQWWTPVKWDNEDDPCFHKTAALVFNDYCLGGKLCSTCEGFVCNCFTGRKLTPVL